MRKGEDREKYATLRKLLCKKHIWLGLQVFKCPLVASYGLSVEHNVGPT